MHLFAPGKMTTVLSELMDLIDAIDGVFGLGSAGSYRPGMRLGG